MHLLNNERAPQCINCNESFNCILSKQFSVDGLQTLFLHVKQKNILEYLKETDFHK